VPIKKFYLQATSPLGQKIHTTKFYWDYISGRKHPEVKGGVKWAIATIEEPAIIKQSSQDPKIFVYYRKIKDKYFCVVARHADGEGFMITAYIARKIIKGELVWQKAKR
jgi:hypothetical protein